MYNSNNLPAYKAVFYANDPQTGYYNKTPQQPHKTAVMRLPYQLIVEPTQRQQIKCNAAQLIRGKEKFKKSESFKFLTGLQDANCCQWFTGNDYENLKGKKKLSLCLFKFSVDNSRLAVFYFGRFYIDNWQAREQFVNIIIPILNQRLLHLNTNGEF